MSLAPDLVYYPDSRPGIRRLRRGRGFSYIAPDGTTIGDRKERARLASMAVPPAYEDVWMSPEPAGHLQATGRDARARKQYRYHPDWTAFRAEQKFDNLADFGRALPTIRRAILRDLDREPGSHRFAVAAVLAMLDRLALRVGSRDYAEENRTYGATTLRPAHMNLTKDGLRLSYRSKGGKRVRKILRDATLNRTLNRLADLRGATLVKWIDGNGAARAITAGDVNDRLRDLTGQDAVTGKTFRTWAGSVAALEAATGDAPTIGALSEAAADRLANTPAIARTSYIHPAVIDLVENPAPLERPRPEVAGLRKAERQLLAVLGG